MKLVILDAVTLGKDVDLKRFEEFGELTIYEKTSHEQRLSHIANADIVITNKVIIDADIMQKAKSLKLICICATGTNNVDLQYAKSHGIEVKNVAAYSTKSVAQHTLMQALSLQGKNKYYDQYVKSGQWSDSGIFTKHDNVFCDLQNKRWGIIGLGNIGLCVAKLASAFDCEVLYYSTSGNNTNKTYKSVSLHDLLSTCDIISIHCPLNENTANLIGEDEIKLLKQDAILINVARGGIVDENAIIRALQEEKISFACDVFSKEPPLKSDPLLHVKSDRLLLSPHLAWASIEARKRLMDGVYKNIQEFVKS